MTEIAKKGASAVIVGIVTAIGTGETETGSMSELQNMYH